MSRAGGSADAQLGRVPAHVQCPMEEEGGGAGVGALRRNKVGGKGSEEGGKRWITGSSARAVGLLVEPGLLLV
eukprot:240187-Chlamydomonas_euryale.AAC.1